MVVVELIEESDCLCSLAAHQLSEPPPSHGGASLRTKTEIYAPSEHKKTRTFKPSAEIEPSGDVTARQIPPDLTMKELRSGEVESLGFLKAPRIRRGMCVQSY